MTTSSKTHAAQRRALTSLVVLLDSAAPSFCYYPSPAAGRRSLTMSDETLAATVAHARDNHLALQVVAGADGLTTAQRRLLAGHPHVCYAPAGGELLAEDVPVLDGSRPPSLPAGRHRIAVLRVSPAEIEDWPAIWIDLAERVHRVVLVLLGLDGIGLAQLERYRVALRVAAARLEAAYKQERPIELSVLSDRLALAAPVECGAGIDHLTVDPLGQLHLCPGFAAAGDAPVGTLGAPTVIANRHLLQRDHAPICKRCDAHHCRRCVYLNQRATLEHNTPPWQSCRAAHIEREVTRELLARLHTQGVMQGVALIAPVGYEDPFEALTGRAMTDRWLRPAQPLAEGAIPRPPAGGGGKAGEGQGASPPRNKESPMDQPKNNNTSKPIGRVTPEERDEIRRLFLRKTALTELFLSLGKMDAADLESTPLYEKVVEDMGRVSTAFQAWWDDKSTRYGWERAPAGKWNIDFETCEIFLS